MLIIILSSMALAAEDPIIDDSEWNNCLDVVDNVFTVIFAIEMILKVNRFAKCTLLRLTNTCVLQIIDLGVILHPGSYLREFWNIMDAVVVICAFASFIFQKRWWIKVFFKRQTCLNHFWILIFQWCFRWYEFVDHQIAPSVKSVASAKDY